MSLETTITGQLVDILNRNIYPAEVKIGNGRIVSIQKTSKNDGPFIMPGFIDAHIHIESSMLVPAVFARAAVVHGTVATVSDPHEIANVIGMEGVSYMIANGKEVNFKFFFGAPSCVPATPFETAGGKISLSEIEDLLQEKDIHYLSEMMNWPGVIHQDDEVMSKIKLAQEYGKPVDGHAPGLRGEQVKKYAAAGIHTDHECFTLEEAKDKLAYGMKIIIREGSAAKNFEALYPLIEEFPDKVMLCSDDKHPDELVEGHIDRLVKRAVAKGIDLFHVLRAACLNPITHYNIEVGQLQVGDPADFIVVTDLQDFDVLQTYINGQLVAEKGTSHIPYIKSEPINNFHCTPKSPKDFAILANGKENIKVILPADGQLVTSSLVEAATIRNGAIMADPQRDILKIAVVDRYADTAPAVAFIKGFGLKAGAIASSVAHDSHNIIAVGTSDELLSKAVNTLIDQKGGICAVDDQNALTLPLPVAGIMSTEDAHAVAQAYDQIDKMAKTLGSTLKAPFMTLSFMALLVIPSLKLSDKGLFDGDNFTFTDVLA